MDDERFIPYPHERATNVSLDYLLGLLHDERKARVIHALYCGEQRTTLNEVGRMFGVTRERIRQIEHQALRILREPQRLAALYRYERFRPSEESTLHYAIHRIHPTETLKEHERRIRNGWTIDEVMERIKKRNAKREEEARRREAERERDRIRFAHIREQQRRRDEWSLPYCDDPDDAEYALSYRIAQRFNISKEEWEGLSAVSIRDYAMVIAMESRGRARSDDAT